MQSHCRQFVRQQRPPSFVKRMWSKHKCEMKMPWQKFTFYQYAEPQLQNLQPYLPAVGASAGTNAVFPIWLLRCAWCDVLIIFKSRRLRMQIAATGEQAKCSHPEGYFSEVLWYNEKKWGITTYICLLISLLVFQPFGQSAYIFKAFPSNKDYILCLKRNEECDPLLILQESWQ